MTGDEPLERVQAAFGTEKFARLREIKRKFDPDNVFCQKPKHPACRLTSNELDELQHLSD